jgi:PAS domain S-box-containing protein
MQYTPIIFPLLIVTLLLLSLAIYSWDKRSVPGTRVFLLLIFALSAWSLSHLGDWVFIDFQTKYFFQRLQYFSIATVPILWVIFALEITGRGRFIKTRNIVLLSIFPAVNLIGVWTNDWHHLFWGDVSVRTINGVSKVATLAGPWFWVHATYSYVLLLAGTYILLRSYQRSSQPYRQQLLLLLVASIAPWIANAATIFDWTPASWEGLDLTPFGFFLTGLAMAWGLFSYRLLDLVPVARDVIFERMSEGVIVISLSRKVVDMNSAAEVITGKTTADSIGNIAADVFRPWFQADELLVDSSIGNLEISLAQPNGTRFYSVGSTPLQNRYQQLSGWTLVLQDISERKDLEQAITLARDEAVAASELKTRLLANVSHDLRTPLGAILGYSEMLQTGVHGEVNSEQSRALTNILDSTEELLTFVNNLIGQAQLDSGKLLLNVETFEPREFFTAFQSTANALARAKDLDFEFEIHEDVPEKVFGDIYWLRQIVINLVGNAVKFTEAGEVKVEIQKEDETYWAIKVSDTGIGIAPASQAKIFEPFGQVDGQEVDGKIPQGSGLGLSIVRQLVDLMGGRVMLESEVGQGSTFTVSIPWSKEE